MPNQPSISRLLTVWLSGGLLVFWLIAVGLGVYVMQDEFGEIFDSSLQETAERLAPLVVDDLFCVMTTPRPGSLNRSTAPCRMNI